MPGYGGTGPPPPSHAFVICTEGGAELWAGSLI